MKFKTLGILSVLLLGISVSANAEEELYYYGSGNTGYGQTDPLYQVPQSYNGHYYPEEQEPTVSYYGVQRESKNEVSNDIRDQSNAYDNYYY